MCIEACVSYEGTVGLASDATSKYPWDLPYDEQVGFYYGISTDPLGIFNLANVSKAFGNSPATNCTRGCLLDFWLRGGGNRYDSGFFSSHRACYVACGMFYKY